MKKTLSLVALTCFVASCAPRGDGSFRRTDLGAITGALVGGVVGNQFGKGTGKDWATFGGALYGSAVGSDWGSAVDRYQLQGKTRSSNGVFEYLPDNTYKAWVNPNTGQTETIRPVQTYSPDGISNQPCRLFETTRGSHSAIGMVCRDRYGRWRLIE